MTSLVAAVGWALREVICRSAIETDVLAGARTFFRSVRS